MWRRPLATPTAKLTATYIAIIMTLSIAFSCIFYNTSYRQLGRQLPPRSMSAQQQPVPPTDDINEFLKERIREGRIELLNRLIILNAAAFIIGIIISYGLARRQLEPIEAAMEAQTQFVSDASHELRTPLTALQVTNEVALRKPKLTKAETEDLLRHNISEVVALRDLSNALLGLVKPADAVEALPVALQPVVTDAINRTMSKALDKQVAIDETVPDIAFKGTAAGLEQVLIILLDNAVKYGDTNGSITITAALKSKYILLTVSDDGPGITSADMPHIFERFYRADKSRGSEGYGLGLAIAYKVIEQMDGTIHASSDADGTSFTIRLNAA